MRLEGKRVLVTGGARRIGRAIVLAFAEEGAKIAIHHLDSAEEAEELLAAIGGRRMGHTTIRFDLAKPIPDDFFRGLGKTDILVNNASVYLPDIPADPGNPLHRRQMRVNYLSPLRLSKLFSMQKNGEGLVINLLDCRHVREKGRTGSYALSKARLAEATRPLALSLAPEIRVVGIALGAVLPPSGSENLGQDAAEKAAPLGRLPSVGDVAASAVFLARNDSVTGQIVYVDCGRHLNAQ